MTAPFWSEPDWHDLRNRLGALEAEVREAQPDIPWRDVSAEALRRLVLDHHGGLMVRAQATYELESEQMQAQRNYDRHAAEMRALRESRGSEEAEVRKRVGAFLRDAANNPRLVSSRYRAEGVRMAAGWIDGGARDGGK